MADLNSNIDDVIKFMDQKVWWISDVFFFVCLFSVVVFYFVSNNSIFMCHLFSVFSFSLSAA